MLKNRKEPVRDVSEGGRHRRLAKFFDKKLTRLLHGGQTIAMSTHARRDMGHLRSKLVTGAAVGAAAIGGAAIANAATSTNSTSSSSTTSGAAPTHPRANVPAHGTAVHEGAEKVVTGTAATKASAAAVKAAGGGTAGKVTTDYTGDSYEVTVTKTDGSTTEIHLDSSFNAVQGRGGHRGGRDCSGGGSSGSDGPTGPGDASSSNGTSNSET
jgi:hypothetical protein